MKAINLNYSRRYGTEPARCHVWVGGYKTGNAQSFPHRKGYTTPFGGAEDVLKLSRCTVDALIPTADEVFQVNQGTVL